MIVTASLSGQAANRRLRAWVGMRHTRLNGGASMSDPKDTAEREAEERERQERETEGTDNDPSVPETAAEEGIEGGVSGARANKPTG